MRIFVKAITCFVIVFVSFSIAAANTSTQPNLIKNGDFAKISEGTPVEWGLGPGAECSKASPNGSSCLKIATPIQQYSTAVQYIPIDGSKVKQISLSGKVRYSNVTQGEHDYDVLRAFIMWFDKMGRQVGDYANAGFWKGSSGWVSFDKKIDVPSTATRAQVVLGLHNCTGVCYFSDISMKVTKGNKSFTRDASDSTDTSTWWPFIARETPAQGTPIDLSYLSDAPAGKHGFLTARDGHFYFQDGTRARFWGFDIMGSECFPNHKTARRLAERLSRMGVNILRLHHMDASWADPNIFDPKYDDTQHLSASSMDKLDYFTYQLKQHGIYIYLDWLVNRHFKKGDNVEGYQHIDDGAKIVSHYDPRIIALEKKYMSQVLNHKNAYTGICYKDEPQIALSEVINEDSVFYEDWYNRVPPSYLNELTKICRKYEPKANPAHHPFDKPTLRALYQIESKYYKEMRKYLKYAGLKCPTTGSNHWENIGPALLCDSQTDYIDRHYYWDHPKDGFGWQQEFDNLPMLACDDSLMPVEIASTKVAGKPMVVTEWCFCWINDWTAEGPLLGAAYACQQDWDVMIWFDISSALPYTAMSNEFDISNKPNIFAQWTAASLLFHRRDLAPLPDVLEYKISPEELLEGKSMCQTLEASDTLKGRIETQITSDTSNTPLPEYKPNESCMWDQNQGWFTVKSPRTIALDGYLNKSYDLDWIHVANNSDFCSLWLTSLDGLPIHNSKHILVTAAARAENSGMKFNIGRTHLVNPGTAPILIEPVKARLNFADDVIIRPLNQDGTPEQAIKANSIDLSKYHTFWFDITRQ